MLRNWTHNILPALFETTVKSFAPCFIIADNKFSGIPHNPKPPTNNLAPFGISFTASSTLWNTLLCDGLVEKLHVKIWNKINVFDEID